MQTVLIPDETAPAAMSHTPDDILLQQIQAGDEEALVALHARYAPLVYSVAYRVLNEPMAAEEVTQDTFWRLWKKAFSYDPEKGHFVTWLLTITRRLAIDHFRRRQRREPQAGLLFMDEDPDLWEHTLAADGGDLRRALVSALDQLQPEQRDLIELAYFYGLTHTDLAEMLGIPLGTVKTRLRLGMQKLRQIWLAEVKPAEGDSS
jgi:RNA polymerase sigma-70 factor (ECF subfamily)